MVALEEFWLLSHNDIVHDLDSEFGCVNYSKFNFVRFFGTFQFLMPRLQVKDIELIKKIGIRDYEHFLDHNNFVSEESDPMFARSLISLKGTWLCNAISKNNPTKHVPKYMPLLKPEDKCIIFYNSCCVIK